MDLRFSTRKSLGLAKYQLLSTKFQVPNFPLWRIVNNTMRKAIKFGLGLSGVYLLLAAAAGVVIGEGSLKLQRRPLRHRQEAAVTVAARYHAQLQDVSVTAMDGVTL